MSRDERSPSDERVHVATADEIPPGERQLVEVDGMEVGVFNLDGEFHALANYCPHRGGPVCEGDVVNALSGEWPGVGERTVERYDGDPAITCPWHGWEFDVATGVHLGDDSLRVPTYDVTVEEGTVYVEKR